MRRILAVLMMLSCLFFASCEKKDSAMQSALDFRTKLLQSKGCRFACTAEADYGERVYSFSLDCSYDGEDGFLTVTKPSEIAGITAEIDGDDAVLRFDGFSLEYGALANGHLAPLTIPWLLGSAWTQDYISSAGKDGESTRVTYLKGYHDQELIIDTWLVQDAPKYVEVSYGGQRVLCVEIENFSLTK